MKITVLSDDKTLKYAADELAVFLKKMTEDPYEITLGLLPEGSVKEVLTDDKYVISVKNGIGTIYGSNPRSVLMGVYRYLKELGCRYVRPGKDGDYIPTVTLAKTNIQIEQSAFYPFRVECLEGAITTEMVKDTIKWLPKVGYNAFFIQFLVPYVFFNRLKPECFSDAGLNHEEHVKKCYDVSLELTKEIENTITTVGLQFHDIGHGYTFEPFGVHFLDHILTRDIPEEKRAEIEPYLPLRDGKRRVLNGCINWTNLCLSNKHLAEITADWFVDFVKSKPEIDFLHIWLGDGANNHCECENCMKQSVSDMYIDMLNVIDEKFERNGLDTKIVSIQYVNTRQAPEKSRLNNPNRFILMPAISRSYLESYSDEKYPYQLPDKTNRNDFKAVPDFRGCMKLFEGWREQYPNLPVVFFDYNLYSTHFTDPGYMFVSNIFAQDVKMLDKVGSNGIINCKTQRSYFPTSLPVYASGALLEDPSRDYDEIVNEYFEASFGDKGSITRTYLEKISTLCDQRMIKQLTSVENFKEDALGEKRPLWRDNPEAEKLFEQIEPTVNDFLSKLDGFISEESDPCRKRSFSLLKYHGELVKLYGKALLEGSKGNKAESDKYAVMLKEYASANEEHYMAEFDVFLFNRAMDVTFNLQ